MIPAIWKVEVEFFHNQTERKVVTESVFRKLTLAGNFL